MIRGLDPETFSYEVLRAYGLDGEPQMPALVISDAAPKDVQNRKADGATVTTIVVPLRIRDAEGSVKNVLSGVVNALRDEDALQALKALDRSQIEKRWGWLRWLELKPNFIGLGINVNQLIEDLFFRSK